MKLRAHPRSKTRILPSERQERRELSSLRFAGKVLGKMLTVSNQVIETFTPGEGWVRVSIPTPCVIRCEEKS